MSALLSNSLYAPGLFKEIKVSQIKEARNIRKELVGISELATSIQQKGLLQPILVRTVEGHFQIVAGNRRFRACKSLGWKKIVCQVLELDDKQALEVSLTENIQRKTLSALEEANAFKSYVSDFGWGGVSELALKVGKSVSYITKRLKLLDLPADVLHSITSHKLNTSIAEELFSIKDKSTQSELASLISNRRLSLRRSRDLLKEINTGNLDSYSFQKDDYSIHVKTAENAFAKTISLLRIAMNSLGDIINSVEYDWVIYEILMQHKNMMHTQIDILIKEKKKL